MKRIYQSAFELRVLLLNKHHSIFFLLPLKVSGVKIISWPLLFSVVLLCISFVVLPSSCGLFNVYTLFSLKYSLQWSGLGHMINLSCSILQHFFVYCATMADRCLVY